MCTLNALDGGLRPSGDAEAGHRSRARVEAVYLHKLPDKSKCRMAYGRWSNMFALNYEVALTHKFDIDEVAFRSVKFATTKL